MILSVCGTQLKLFLSHVWNLSHGIPGPSPSHSRFFSRSHPLMNSQQSSLILGSRDMSQSCVPFRSKNCLLSVGAFWLFKSNSKSVTYPVAKVRQIATNRQIADAILIGDLGTLGISWELSETLGNSRKLLGTLGNSWKLLGILGNSWDLVGILGNLAESSMNKTPVTVESF